MVRACFPSTRLRRDEAAFDRTGARLGYGGGCYDRYLPTLSPACQVIGIAFDEQRVDHVPTDAHDLSLPNIVSA